MNTKTGFINRHYAQLPIKYARISVSSFLHKTDEPTYIEELKAIEKQFLKFIEVPDRRSDK